MVVQMLNKELKVATMLDPLVHEIRKTQGLYAECQMQHVYKEGNWVVDRLAHFAWNVEDISIWWNYFSDFLSQAIWFNKYL